MLNQKILFKGKSNLNPKKCHTSLRLAATSSDLKRSFYENNQCGLNLKSPRLFSKHTSKMTVERSRDVPREKQSLVTSNNHGHISIFRDIENCPEAKKWVQARKGQHLNSNVSSSVEYDGDVFLPSGI